MAIDNNWVKWCDKFLGTSFNRDRVVIEVLRQRYVDEMHGVDRLTQHAERMDYRQFCQKLREIAADKATHAAWIGERIIALGAQLPKATEWLSTGENSWQHLRTDLEEEKRSTDRLSEQIWRTASDHPEISKFLQRIFDAEKLYVQQITDMLMRSDGFAHSLA